MIFEKILTFILFLGPLVFFHELGHFLFARLFGVRVEVFSIGFGPKIFKYKKSETEYAISIIPLGGYVKMFGDDPFSKEEIPKEERKYSYNHQSKWARFWIVFGGPLTNFLLAFFIYFNLLMIGEKVPEIKIGYLDRESHLSKVGLQTGDVLLKINDSEVFNPTDLMGETNKNINTFTVRRKNKVEEIYTNIPSDKFFEEIMKHPPFLRKPILANFKGEYFFLKNKNMIEKDLSLEEILDNSGAQLDILLYPIANLQKEEIKEEDLIKNVKPIELKIQATNLKVALQSLESTGFKTVDMMVKSVNIDSPAEKAGIKAGDIFTTINNETVVSFDEFREKLQLIKTEKAVVGFYRNGKLETREILPNEMESEGKKLKLLGVYSHIELQKVEYIQTKSKGLVGSTVLGVKRTIDSFNKTIDGFYKLITNQVSFKQVGGVISIGKVANDSFNISFSYFLQLMALISVNLGVINLFPMLPLDGGHITFLFLELINRGPISRRKMEIAQQVGLSLLLMLMVGAIFNDFSRFF